MLTAIFSTPLRPCQSHSRFQHGQQLTTEKQELPPEKLRGVRATRRDSLLACSRGGEVNASTPTEDVVCHKPFNSLVDDVQTRCPSGAGLYF